MKLAELEAEREDAQILLMLEAAMEVREDPIENCFMLLRGHL